MAEELDFTEFRREDVNLDDVDFAPILNLLEQLLDPARQLADWTDDGEIGWEKDKYTDEPLIDEFNGEPVPNGALGNAGTDLLQRIAEKWVELHCEMVANRLWENWTSYSGEEAQRLTAVRCLHDLRRTVFRKEEWSAILPMDYDRESGEAIWYHPLPPGTRLGIPHGAFAKKLTVAVELLRNIVRASKPQRKTMTVAEANEKANKLTDTAERKKSFFALSQRKQARRIGCSWRTWSKKLFQKHDFRTTRGWNGSHTPPILQTSSGSSSSLF